MNGERLKKARKACGYTQVSLAKALNVSKGSVAMWETGKRNPEFETLEALLSLLNVSYDYLTGKSEETAHNTLITDEKKMLSAWTVEDELYDTFRKFLALDPYGINAATQVIMSEYQRCSAQKTLVQNSAYTLSIDLNKSTSNAE